MEDEDGAWRKVEDGGCRTEDKNLFRPASNTHTPSTSHEGEVWRRSCVYLYLMRAQTSNCLLKKKREKILIGDTREREKEYEPPAALVAFLTVPPAGDSNLGDGCVCV